MNYLAELLYNPSSMVVAAQGQTNPSPPLQSNAEGGFGHNVASALDAGKNVGQSFLTYVNALQLAPVDPVIWEYLYAPRIIMGDPTLTRLKGCAPSPDSCGDSSGGGGCFITMAADGD